MMGLGSVVAEVKGREEGMLDLCSEGFRGFRWLEVRL